MVWRAARDQQRHRIRKILADLAVTHEAAFKSIVDQTKNTLEKKNKKAT